MGAAVVPYRQTLVHRSGNARSGQRREGTFVARLWPLWLLPAQAVEEGRAVQPEIPFCHRGGRCTGQRAQAVGRTGQGVAPALHQALRGVPQVSYEDIGGLTDEIKKVREMIELPLRHPEIFEKLGIEAPKGVLLYGPPGTGKTLLAKAVANESNAHFISISGPEIMSKFYGESEARLREIFKEAREKAPSIVFVDEIDSIAPKREEVTGEVERRVVSQMLSLMDGLEARGKVIVISATNRPNAIDPALRRPGRFDREIEIKVPDKKGRKSILTIHTRNMPLAEDVNIDKVSAISHGYVGADLEYLCKEAAMKCLRRLLPEINLDDEKLKPEILDKLIVNNDDFKNALREITPSGMREVYIEIQMLNGLMLEVLKMLNGNFKKPSNGQ